MDAKNQFRVLVVIIVAILLIPVATTGLSHQSNATAGSERSVDELRRVTGNVTFISTQGGSTHVYEHAGKLVAVHTPTKQVLFEHDRYRRYMDVDPIGRSRLLVTASERTDNGFRRVAVVLNWRTNTTINKFEVPGDTHDIDRLSDDTYAIADKENDVVTVYDPRTNSVTWEFDFSAKFPSSDGGPAEDYTHLNDVDPLANETQFLVSPRNFDRVMLINRSDKSIAWTLGAEDDYSILNEQHNPELVSRNPATVLVSDSENDRIIEYQRNGSSWSPIWVYNDDLNWPRDADRFPNGNTLITDTLNDRVIEVTPGREVVWEYNIERSPYDAERLRYGDEPRGPPMTQFSSAFGEVIPDQGSRLSWLTGGFVTTYERTYQIAVWGLPAWIDQANFAWLLAAALLLVGWVGTEATVRVPSTAVRERVSLPSRLTIAVAVGFGVAGLTLLALVPSAPQRTGLYAGIGLAGIGYSLSKIQRERDHTSRATARIADTMTILWTVAALLVAVLLTVSQVGASDLFVLYVAIGLLNVAIATDIWADE